VIALSSIHAPTGGDTSQEARDDLTHTQYADRNRKLYCRQLEIVIFDRRGFSQFQIADSIFPGGVHLRVFLCGRHPDDFAALRFGREEVPVRHYPIRDGTFVGQRLVDKDSGFGSEPAPLPPTLVIVSDSPVGRPTNSRHIPPATKPLSRHRTRQANSLLFTDRPRCPVRNTPSASSCPSTARTVPGPG
jgi:hypothetical protein